jgi:hypothetical protein
MEVLATPSYAEFITGFENVEDKCYDLAIPKLPSKGSETAQEGGDDLCSKAQCNVELNPEQTWVDSTRQPLHSNVLNVEETIGKNATVERKIFSYHTFRQYN